MARINIHPVTVNVTHPDGCTSHFRYCPMGRHALWIEAGLRGRELRRRLRETTRLDKRQRRRFMRLYGGGWAQEERWAA